MKDKICATLTKDHIYICSTSVIGRSGENECTQLEITLDECLCDKWVYIDFIKPDGSKYKTPKLDIVDNKVIYDIPNALLQERGYLKVQVVLQNDEGEIWKSNIKTYGVNPSINATDDIPNQEDFITEAQRLLNEVENGLTPTIGENGNWFICDKDTGKPSKGETGPEGPEGPEGPQGLQGEKGETAITVNVGSVETVDFDTPANVTNVGTDKDLILDFVLPKGKDGYTPIKGKDYFDGEKGDDYTITNADYQNIANVVENDIKPTLESNLKSAKDYTDNAIIRDFKDISYNEETATFTFTRHDNTTFTVDLPIEATVADGRYDDSTKELVLVLVSGQEIKIPVSGLIDDYDGLDSATIQCVVSADNKITCNIVSGSISKTLLTTELQQEINNKVNNDTFTTELGKKINVADVEEKQLLITYEDATTETIKLVVYK